jgi:hypothetical protein
MSDIFIPFEFIKKEKSSLPFCALRKTDINFPTIQKRFFFSRDEKNELLSFFPTFKSFTLASEALSNAHLIFPSCLFIDPT